MKLDLIDIPVKVKEEGDDKCVYSHPSYGMVKISRTTYGGAGMELFGSKHPCSSYISITISEADNTQRLGKNWYFSTRRIVEVGLSPVQYAELVSNPNTEGVPCTINYRADQGHIVYKPHATEVDYLQQKIKDLSDNLKGKLKSDIQRIKEILSQKGTLKKADKEEIANLVERLGGTITDGIPFYQESLDKSLKSMVMEANSDIENMVTNIQTRLGKFAMDNPEGLAKLLKDVEKETTDKLENKD